MPAPHPRFASWLDSVGQGPFFEALAAVSDDAAVFAVDADRNIVFWSAGAERLLGFAADEVLGEHCLKANRCDTCMSGCGISEKGMVLDRSMVLYRADGRKVRFRKNARGFFDADGRFLGGLEVLVPVERTRTAARRRPHDDLTLFHGISTRSPQMLRVLDGLRSLARTDSPMLLVGEPGSGRTLAASAVHSESARSSGPFTVVRLDAVPEALADGELFGRATPGGSVLPGRLAEAAGGTLVLHGIEHLPIDVQRRLDAFISQDGSKPRDGSDGRAVRIVAVTGEDLTARVDSGRFDRALLAHLSPAALTLPPLRERTEDLESLVWNCIDTQNRSGGRQVVSIAPAAMQALLDSRWPGNFIELQRVVGYAYAVGRGSELALADLPPELHARRPAAGNHRPGRVMVDEAQRIEAALAAADGHIGKAAEMLGMSRPTLWRKRRKYGIPVSGRAGEAQD